MTATTDINPCAASAGPVRKSRKGLAAIDPRARINISFTVAGSAREALEAGAAACQQTVGRYMRDLALAHLAAGHNADNAIAQQVGALAADIAAIRATLAG